MLPFWLSIGALSLVQALLVFAPQLPERGTLLQRLGGRLERLGGRWWALIMPLSIGVVIAAVALEEEVARGLTYLALVAVPPLAAVALARLLRGGRPALSILALPLFALAWAARGSLSAQTAALALSALACVSLGWAIVRVVPARWLKLGIYAMAAVDAWLVASDLLQAPNAVINTVSPGGGLPRLQFVTFGSAIMGFGDLFIAATLGSLLAGDRRLQRRGAAIAVVLCVGFDLLFFFVSETPSTVPIALTLAVLDLSLRKHGQVRPEGGVRASSRSA
ncbi:MAG TPA: hypothetical protein VF731_05740 [Solirubrobacterales bacterium]